MNRPALHRFFCESCLGRADAPGDCPRCSGEPLLDLANSEVREMLESFDDSAKTKRYSLVLGIVVVATMPVSFALIFALLGLLVGGPISAAIVFGLTALFVKMFPVKRRAPVLSEQELFALDQLGVG